MYLPLSWLSRRESIKTLDKIAETTTLTKLTTVQNATRKILEKKEMLEACQRLDAEITAGNIASYTILGPESSCYKPNGMAGLPPIKDFDKATSFVVKGIPLTFIKYSTPPYQWALSVITPEKTDIINLHKTNKALQTEIIKDFLLVIYNVFAFILCAVLIFSESIKNRYKQSGKDPTWLNFLSKIFGFLQLYDIKIIKSATSALVQHTENLNKDIDLLQTSLEHSILNEIKKNNQNIPYRFHGTVAKVDINGFSKVVAAGQSETIQEMTLQLEDFGCELLQRYDGLFEKTIGDEIVVVFKGSDSALKAAAFARDLMREFSNLEFLIGGEIRKFTLKSAIFSSNITFSKRTSGYGFTGDALTYTTRLMDAANIREKNILSITEAQGSDVIALCNLPTPPQEFKFKNMQTQNGFLISDFTQLNLNNSDTLFYFKSDGAIETLFQSLKNNAPIDTILDALLKINVRVAKANNITHWLVLIQQIPSLDLNTSQTAKLIMLGKNLIPQNQWPKEATTALLSLPRNIEGRINASIIEVLMAKDIQALNGTNQNSFIIANDLSGRTKSNILVFKALNKLDNSVFNDFIAMIRSHDPNLSKSGIYGACQIIEYYKIQNPAALETFKSYTVLLGLLFKIKNSEKIQLSERLKERLQSL